MKKFLFSSLIAGISLVQPLTAALSPLYQSAAEFRAIIEDPRLTQNLPNGESIESICFDTHEERYIVETENYERGIDIEYKPNQGPGPQQFELTFQEPLPRRAKG